MKIRKHFIIFLPLVAFACTNPENTTNETELVAVDSVAVEMERNDWSKDHLKGNVKTITETPYLMDSKGEMAEMDSCCVEILEFNDMGFLIKKTEKNDAGAVASESVIEHTETGKFISRTRTENGKQVWKRTVTRDENGKVISAVDTDSTMQVTAFYEAEVLNEFNQPVSGKSFAPDSTFEGTWSWKYTDGLVTGRGWKDENGVQLVDRTGEVNDMGWLSKVVDTRVDDKGKTTTKVETYTYDSFDETGNWTQCTLSEDGKPMKIMQRTYTYY